VTIDPAVSAVLPSPAPSQVLGWNGAGTALENKNLPDGIAVYSSTANTNLGVATSEAVTPKALHDSIYNPNGKHMVPVLAASMVPDLTSPPAVASVSLGSGKPNFVGYDFDKDTAEYLHFTLPMPPSYDGGSIVFQAVWTGATTAGIVGNPVSWALSAVTMADGESLNQSLPNPSVSNDQFQGANAVHISPLSGAITATGTPTGGELMAFRFYRNATASINDTYDQDARLIAVLVYFSTAKGNDA
jgi:hypothetical protein